MALQSHSVIEPVSHTVRHHPSSEFLICSSLFSLCDLAVQHENGIHNYVFAFCFPAGLHR